MCSVVSNSRMFQAKQFVSLERERLTSTRTQNQTQLGGQEVKSLINATLRGPERSITFGAFCISCCFQHSAITSIRGGGGKGKCDDTKSHLHFFFPCRCSSRKRILKPPLVLLSRTLPHLRDRSGTAEKLEHQQPVVPKTRTSGGKKLGTGGKKRRGKQVFGLNFSQREITTRREEMSSKLLSLGATAWFQRRAK